MTPSAEVVAQSVSRETFERLEAYVDILKKWNPRINIVAPSTLPDVWGRHILDSLQLSGMHALDGHWADFGSGGGFPGLVVAIAGHGSDGFRMTLVESDQRKAAFLRTVLREVGVSADVLVERIESLNPLGADVITARALASLDQLFSYSLPHSHKGTVCLFHKGGNWKAEVDEAEQRWQFDYDFVPSRTNADSVILKVRNLARD